MSRRVSGVLYLPNGNATGSGTLIFIASQTSDTVLEGTISTVSVTSGGAYDVTLENGRYLVYFERAIIPKVYLGKVTITTSSTTTLNDLLIQTEASVPDSVSDYIDSIISGLDYQAAGAYLTADYDSLDTPTTPTNFAVEIVTNTQQTTPIYSIAASWDPSTSQSGNLVKYRVSYYMNVSQTTVVDTTEEFYSIIPVLIGETYYLEVRAYSGVNSNRLAAGYASATITVTPLGVQAISADTVTGASTLNAIVLRWTNPAAVTGPLIHVYSDTEDTFEPSVDNRVYTGFAETFTHQVTDTYERFYKFVVQDQTGTLSSITGPCGEFHAIRISETTIGQMLEDGAIQAAHIADGAIVQDKIAARGIAASKIGVMDLTNLVENQNFTEYDEDEGDFPGWDWGSTEPVDPGPDGYATLPQNTTFDNEYQFECSEGDKFYGSVKLNWSSLAGFADKGFLIVFLDDEGNELNSGYTATNTETTVPAELQLVEGFEDAPQYAVKAFMRIKTGAVAADIDFTSVICRKGAAVLIEPEGITATKINVADLFALKIRIETGGAIYVGDNPGDQVDPAEATTAGLILGSAQGFQTYDASGNLTVDIDPATGNAVFKGNISGSTLSGGSVSAGAVTVGTYGNIHSSGKDDYGDASAGFFIGYSGGAYKVDLGTGSKYLRWDGTNLTLAGDLSAAGGTFAGNLSAAGGTFSGSLSAVGGTFTGTLSAATGSFSGAITASSGSITGDLEVSGGLYGGKTGWVAAGSGFFIGNEGNGPRFIIGTNGNGDYLSFNGSQVLRSSGTSWSGSLTATVAAGVTTSRVVSVGISAGGQYSVTCTITSSHAADYIRISSSTGAYVNNTSVYKSASFFMTNYGATSITVSFNWYITLIF